MNYRIAAIATICATLLTAAPQAGSHKRGDDPDLKEMRDYRLSMDKIDQYIKAYKDMEKQGANSKCVKESGNAPTLDQGQKLIEACPAALSALKAEGLKPREFLILTAAIIGDYMAVGMKQKGQIKEYPSTISPENAAFFEQNYDKLKAKLAPLLGN